MRTWKQWLWTISAGLVIGGLVSVIFDKTSFLRALLAWGLGVFFMRIALKLDKTLEQRESNYRGKIVTSLDFIRKSLAELSQKPYSDG